MSEQRYNELMRLSQNGSYLTRPQLEELKDLKAARQAAGKVQAQNPLLVELSRFIGQEVDAQLKKKLEAQAWEIVEELQDKFRYLIDQYGLPNPTAAEIALWKEQQKE